MATVYIVRHGNTFDTGEVVRRVGGRTDLPLSQSGQTQATALGAHFAKTAFDRAIVSPLQRTRQTADAILAAQADGVPTTFDARLVEVDYGPDEGKPEVEVVARLGEAALAAWDRDAVVPSGWHIDPAAARRAWSDLLSGLDGTTLIVTSNGVARFVLDIVEHDGVERKLKTGAYGILHREEDSWRVTEWNIRP